MCSNPITANGKTFACRVCNRCISARKNDWVARAMAEKDTSGETIVIELTYRNDPDGTLPDSAKVFKYSDVSGFLKRLRQAYFRHYGARGEIRFIVAGERGSKRNRVHWHMVIFADRQMSNLGEWTDFVGLPLSEMRYKKMDHWSFWPHGHVYVKEANQEGMEYCLKYALKDQFNVVKSRGTAREAKAELTGASCFRMSKQPPIGFRWLERQCDRWEEKGAVPPRLHLSIPDYRGYWWPKGQLREYLLGRLHIINERVKAKAGRDAPQWKSLLSSVECLENINDFEVLTYGPEEIYEEEEKTVWQWQEEFGHDFAKVRTRCGGLLPCRQCFRGFTPEAGQEFLRWYNQQAAAYVTDTDAPANITPEQWFRAKKQINPFCALSDLDDRDAAFCA